MANDEAREHKGTAVDLDQRSARRPGLGRPRERLYSARFAGVDPDLDLDADAES